MAIEYPWILAHNLNRDGVHFDWTSEVAGHESDKTQDDIRFTTWRATSAATQNLEVRQATALPNFHWDDTAAGWSIVKTGVNTVTYERDTANAYEGGGCAKVDVSAYTSGVISLEYDMRRDFEEGKTYYIAAAFKCASGSNTIIIGYSQHDGTPLATQNVTAVGTTYKGGILTYTADADYPGARAGFVVPTAVQTTYIDSVLCAELRDIDTGIIDGHNLQGATIDFQYRMHPTDTWTSASSGVAKNNKVYIDTWTAVAAPIWRVVITGATTSPEIAQIWIGERYTLTHNPVGFDPDAAEATVKETMSDAGIARTYFNYTQRLVNADFKNLHPTVDFPGWEQWWQDIGKGRYPFWWLWRPTSAPTSPLFLKLTNRTLSFPFDKYSRSGGFAAQEILGLIKL